MKIQVELISCPTTWQNPCIRTHVLSTRHPLTLFFFLIHFSHVILVPTYCCLPYPHPCFPQHLHLEKHPSCAGWEFWEFQFTKVDLTSYGAATQPTESNRCAASLNCLPGNGSTLHFCPWWSCENKRYFTPQNGDKQPLMEFDRLRQGNKLSQITTYQLNCTQHDLPVKP